MTSILDGWRDADRKGLFVKNFERAGQESVRSHYLNPPCINTCETSCQSWIGLSISSAASKTQTGKHLKQFRTGLGYWSGRLLSSWSFWLQKLELCGKFWRARKRSMGLFFDEPKYPVIDKAPSFWKTGRLKVAAGLGCRIVVVESILTSVLYQRSRQLQPDRLRNLCTLHRSQPSIWLGSGYGT